MQEVSPRHTVTGRKTYVDDYTLNKNYSYIAPVNFGVDTSEVEQHSTSRLPSNRGGRYKRKHSNRKSHAIKINSLKGKSKKGKGNRKPTKSKKNKRNNKTVRRNKFMKLF